MNAPKKVIIIGGTHGNEWTGIILVKKYAEQLSKEFPQLDLHFVLANPKAYELNQRYVDEDLNRAFQFLNEDRADSYEHKRALELKAMINEAPTFVIDLHTTTSNMGNTVIISHDRPMNLQVASHLVKILPDTRVIASPDPGKKYLASQSELGLMVEVGPVANNVINGTTLLGTLNLVKEILRSLSGVIAASSDDLEVYEEIENIHYPQNENGEITAYIHPDFQNKDFAPLEGNYLPFRTFTGEDLTMTTREKMYPIFINEAAYYKTKMAFTLCRKKILKL